MKKNLFICLILLTFLVGCAASQKGEKENFSKSGSKMKWNYPETKRELVADDYFGVKIEDYYRYLEKSDSKEVREWTAAQNDFTEKTIFAWEETKKIEKRLSELWNYDKMALPIKKGGKLFYRYQTGLQNQPVLMARFEDGTQKELVNPNLNSEGATAMDWWSVSPKGTYVAYGLSENGSEQSVLHLIETASGKEVDKPIEGCRYASVGWTPDEKSFYYSKNISEEGGDEIDTKQTVRLHKIGEKSENDEIIASNSIKESILTSSIDEQGKWLLLTEYQGSSGKAKIALYNIETKEKRAVVDNYDNIYEGMIFDGNIYLKTDKGGALNWKIEKINCETLEWKTAIPEDEKDVIEYFGFSDGKLIVSKMHDVASKIYLFDIDGSNEKEIKLPALGSASFSSDPMEKEIFISFSSFAFPPAIYEYLENGETKLFWRAQTPVNVDEIVTERLFYASKDGTKIPIFIIYKKGLEKNGKNPTILRGYGGFNVVYPLYFSVSNAAWIENGGIVAIANIRGGGEYGEKWHRAGMLEKKQNSFDDFAYAMKFLASEKYTSPEKLAIWGGSNGGLLTGAMITQFPELFKAAVSAVPLLDMLRFHTFLIGRYWVSEYGSSDDKEQFDYILKYSPYQNVKKNGRFPAVLLTAGEDDSRVHPMHAKKMAAALQYENRSDNPIFLWVETKAGHGQGKSTKAKIRESAMEMGFFLKMLGGN